MLLVIFHCGLVTYLPIPDLEPKPFPTTIPFLTSKNEREKKNLTVQNRRKSIDILMIMRQQHQIYWWQIL